MGLKELTLFINPGVNAWASEKASNHIRRCGLNVIDSFGLSSIPLNHLFQHRMARLIQFQDELAEECVSPGEPGAGEFLWVVLIERLVHESPSGMRGLKHPETKQNLVVTGAGQGPHDNSQRPDHVQADVRSTDAFRRFAAK